MIPDLDYPKHGTKMFHEDIESVKHHYNNKCLTKTKDGMIMLE